MAKLPLVVRYFGVHKVRVFHGDPVDPATPSVEVKGQARASGGYLPIDTEITVGDVIEYQTGKRRPLRWKLVTRVNEADGFIDVTWTSVDAPELRRQEALRALRAVHPDVSEAVTRLFADGHHSQAVF